MNYVLIVDDCLIQREIVSSLLTASGLVVAEACDGRQAMELIEQQIPALVITDIDMPWMNGYEVCHQIKHNPKTQHIPVVMCSANAETSYSNLNIKLGADAYLRKPFKISKLLNTVRQLLHDFKGDILKK